MEYASASVHYTIVVRTAALAERDVALIDVLNVFEVSEPQGDAGGVLTFGPHQGVEISDNLCKGLDQLGLLYVDDYFVFAPEAPDWCRFGAALTRDFN